MPAKWFVYAMGRRAAGIAEFGRELIKERTGMGRIAALKRGVRFGRPARLSNEQVVLARRLLDEGQSAR